MLLQPYVIQEDRKKIPPEKNISNNILYGTFVAIYKCEESDFRLGPMEWDIKR